MSTKNDITSKRASDADITTDMNLDKGTEKRFVEKVGNKVSRKLRAQRHPGRSIWMGLGTMGIVGWSVAVPTLFGLLLGALLDKRFPLGFSWTLNLLIIGLLVGCIIAWRWVSKETRAINKESNDD